ncbi:hypothetical protein BZA05DRAFT_452656 [Tricharina praecox]|uniref:uncharacterized protein n=1 Tax=Tricharina praecox TaxID=43433 RepID=UPI00221EDC1A|nr:uncharacterized protein BZA05DRAFT_452656 [Tricharina praecox]KAI5851763.1 hypothetical protein BZA05DRAFT_452656 [Tricharina praecox]
MPTRYLPEMSPKRYDLRKRATKPAASAVKPGRKAPKIPKAASGLSKSTSKKYVYVLKPSAMARLADMEFDVHTTLVQGPRFYLQPGGKKRAPSGVVSMVATVPAGVDAQWPVELDFEEMDWEANQEQEEMEETHEEQNEVDDEEMEEQQDQEQDQNEEDEKDNEEDEDQNEEDVNQNEEDEEQKEEDEEKMQEVEEEE